MRTAMSIGESGRIAALTFAIASGSLVLSGATVLAADTSLGIGITLPLTGPDSQDSQKVAEGFKMAIAEANEAHTIPGIQLDAIVYDTATATAGQYDPAIAATSARKLIADNRVVANLG